MARFYATRAAALKAELAEAIPRPVLRALHRRQAWRHLLVAARQWTLLAAGTVVLVLVSHPAVWLPVAVAQGFTVFNFTVLLHEVVHNTVFERRRPLASRLLGLSYAIPSGLSATQFTRWHLDHHAELGSTEADPKRHHLSPKVNARWYKLLYATPALFLIYFRAARRESATYPVDLQRQIARERRLAMAAHIGVVGGLWWAFDFAAAARAHLVPVFLVFPIAFTLNRLGQHYDIDPDDPAQWTTLVKGNWFWDLVFLNSNYHLEHHYFPGVPFYRLPALQRALGPFFARRRMRARGYGELVAGWILHNRVPHTNWTAEGRRGAASGP